jgi:hypothetical protein
LRWFIQQQDVTEDLVEVVDQGILTAPHVFGQPETEAVGRAGSVGARQTPLDLPPLALNILSMSASGRINEI